MWFISVDAFDYMLTQEFGSIVSETFTIEKTHMQYSHELLKQRINAVCTIIFILMLLFLAFASLTTLSHLLLNQFITEHRDNFSSTKNINVQSFGQFYPHNRTPNKR